MEEVGRQIKPGGAGTSSSMFQAQAPTVGLTCHFEQQRRRCQRMHDDYAQFIHSFGTHITVHSRIRSVVGGPDVVAVITQLQVFEEANHLALGHQDAEGKPVDWVH
jgi:hypothetical protein